MNAIAWSSRVYSRLLAFYPDDLCRDYGSEMELVFAEDLESAWRERGMRGVLQVWQCALGEFVRFALPACLSSPVVRVPAIGLAFTILTLGTEILFWPGPRTPTGWNALAWLFDTFCVPITALVVVLFLCRQGAMISLGLSPCDGEERSRCSKSVI